MLMENNAWSTKYIFKFTKCASCLFSRTYQKWKSDIDDIYNDCQHYALIPTFNYENYTRTVEVFEFICNSRPGKLPTSLVVYPICDFFSNTNMRKKHFLVTDWEKACNLLLFFLKIFQAAHKFSYSYWALASVFTLALKLENGSCDPFSCITAIGNLSE